MKIFFVAFCLAFVLSVTTPGAMGSNAGGQGNGNGHGNAGGSGNGKGRAKKSNPEVIESAAASLSVVIAGDSGGNSERYAGYARRLALTLDQKTTGELNEILGAGNHYGLGK